MHFLPSLILAFGLAGPALAVPGTSAVRGESLLGKTEVQLSTRWPKPERVSATLPATQARMYFASEVRVIVHFREGLAVRVEVIRGSAFERIPTAITPAETPALLQKISGGTWKSEGPLTWTNQRGDTATLVRPEDAVLTILPAGEPVPRE